MPLNEDMPSPASDQPFDAAKLYTWVKALESKVNNMARELGVLKEGFLKKNVDMKKEIKSISDELLELRRNEEGTLQKMDIIVKELKQTAGIEDLMVIKKYMEYWNPTNFVTERDVQRVVNARFSQLLEEKNK